MTATDQYGLELSTSSAAAADAYVEGLDLWLRLRPGWQERFAAALVHDPEFALARAALAFQMQFGDDPAPAIAQALAASRHAAHASRRERQHVDVLRRVVARDWVAARRLAAAHVEEFPRDVHIVWQLALLLRYRSEPDRTAGAGALLDRLAAQFGSDPWFIGWYSHALAERGQIEAAERLVQRGLDARPDHGVLAHGRAHVSFEAGDDLGGRGFLAGWLEDHGAGVLNAGHLSWHLALCEIALGDPQRALDLYRARQAGAGAMRLEDSMSLLWRLHLRGVDVSDESQPLADTRPSAGLNHAFDLAHVAFALAGLGDDQGLAHLLGHSSQEALPAGHQSAVLIALVEALRLVLARRWHEAVPPLELVATTAPGLGGSNEQHAVFHETLAVAYRRSGREHDARRVEKEQLAGRAVVPAAGYSETRRVAL